MNSAASNTIDFTRTFHPVGQGAFYSERFISTEEDSTKAEYRIVYDCGSKRSKQWLKTRVSNGIPNKKVNILFLSHFHDDHYKGIEFLEPEIIILPLIDKWDKAIFWLGHELKQTVFDKNYEEELRNRFPQARIIRILPLNNENGPQETVTTLDSDSRNPESASKDNVEDMPSGTVLNLPILNDWIYIPVNPRLDSELINKFRTLLDENPEINSEELLKLDSEYFQAHKKKLKEIYSKLGNPNEYSMAVYSGPNRFLQDEDEYYIDCWYCSDQSRYFDDWWSINRFNYRRHYILSGCLYLGDINLKEKDSKPSTVLRDIYRSLPSWVTRDLCTIQVPHHGSIDSYSHSLKHYYDCRQDQWHEWTRPMEYVISAGIKNRYGHPSPYVISDLLENCHFPVLVTDNSDSLFIEHSRFYQAQKAEHTI